MTSKLSDRLSKVYKAIKKRDGINQKDIIEETNLHPETVSKYVKILQDINRIKKDNDSKKKGNVWLVNKGVDIDQHLREDFTSYHVILHKKFEDPHVKDNSKTLDRISRVVDKDTYNLFRERIKSKDNGDV